MIDKFKVLDVKEEIRYDGKNKIKYNCGVLGKYGEEDIYIVYLQHPSYHNELQERLNRLQNGDVINLKLKLNKENKWICKEII